jgi:hypothetical protein
MTLCDIAGNCRTPLTNLNTIIDITPPPAPTILYPTYTGAVTTNQKPNIK